MLRNIKNGIFAVGRFLKRIFAPIGRFAKKHKVIAGLIAIVLIAALILIIVMPGRNKNDMAVNTEATVTRMTISETISGSSVVEANDEYSVTALVSGEILRADFEEGDIVEKDSVLYEIDSSDTENSVKSSDLSIEKAQNSSNEAYEAIADLTVKAGFSGIVSDVYVSAGDDISSGTKIADIIDNSTMKVRVPFNSSDAANIHVGEAATVTLINNGTNLSGVVSSVSSGSEIINGNMRVSYVTIRVSNPGAVLEGDSVTAVVGDYACNDVGSFEPTEKKSIAAKVSGTVSRVMVVKGDEIRSGSTIATIDSDNVDNQVRNADISLREAQLQRDRLYEQLEDYTITAPISGTVVRKNKKAGDKIETGSAASSDSNVLAVIYDMSSLCFQLDVDELDVKKMQVGQEVTITAEAVEDKTYTGVVENVSINGTIGTNGVTTYPVKVRIQDFDDRLLPGMNIEATIIVNESENALVVPVTAVNRGDTVYVKGEKENENDRAPEGFKTVKIEKGISDDSYVEIISGLSEGDVIYVTPTSGSNQQQFPSMMGGMPGGGMPGGGGMQGGGMPGGGGMQGGGNRSGGGMPGGGMR